MALIGNIKGATGAQGIQGIQGIAGSPGNLRHNGVGPPSAQIGAKLAELTAAIPGDEYYDTANGDIFAKVQAAGSPWLDSP